MSKIPRVLLVCLTSFLVCSCARTVTLHPVTDQDIRQDGEWICMTPDYIEQVVQAKIKAKGL
jgi:hypothetical protein